MTPEEAFELTGPHEEGAEDGPWCAWCGEDWPCTVTRLAALLPAAGEALVLGPEGWEKRRLADGRIMPTGCWDKHGIFYCTLLRGHDGPHCNDNIEPPQRWPLASEEMNP